VDFIVEDCLLGLKAESDLDPDNYVQTLSYLKASGYQKGLLVNSGTRKRSSGALSIHYRALAPDLIAPGRKRHTPHLLPVMIRALRLYSRLRVPGTWAPATGSACTAS